MFLEVFKQSSLLQIILIKSERGFRGLWFEYRKSLLKVTKGYLLNILSLPQGTHSSLTTQRNHLHVCKRERLREREKDTCTQTKREREIVLMKSQLILYFSCSDLCSREHVSFVSKVAHIHITFHRGFSKLHLPIGLSQPTHTYTHTQHTHTQSPHQNKFQSVKEHTTHTGHTKSKTQGKLHAFTTHHMTKDLFHTHFKNFFPGMVTGQGNIDHPVNSARPQQSLQLPRGKHNLHSHPNRWTGKDRPALSIMSGLLVAATMITSPRTSTPSISVSNWASTRSPTLHPSLLGRREKE